MIIYLHKILPMLVSPIFIIIFFLVIGFIFKNKVFIIISIIIFLLSSNSIIANNLKYYLEKDYLIREEIIPKNINTVVVLSGFLKSSMINEKIITEWADADRFFSGLNVFIENNLKFIVFTRGVVPWSNAVPEGEYAKKIAVSLGINEDQILLSDISKNTEEEALSIKKILKNDLNIVLVTSAFHMPRAKFIFEKNDFIVHPYPVDFKYNISNITLIDFIPNAGALNSTSNSLRELIGRIYYLIKFEIFKS